MVKRSKIREFLLVSWMVCAIADCLIYLPVLHRKIQVFEIIFCVFLLFGFIYFSYHMRLMWMLIGLVQFYAQRAGSYRLE